MGLYNSCGRVPTDLRRLVYRLFGNQRGSGAPRGGADSRSVVRQQTWFRDQYQHPHESKHTIGEVLRWFDASNYTFVNSIPKALAFESFGSDDRLFEAHPSGSRLDHAIVQLGMLLNGGREGGLFIVIGRRER